MGKNILLLYNPGAGHGQHDEETLVKAIEAAGHRCSYRSIKEKGWQQIPADTDWLVVAGGDGTVRKVIKRLYEHKENEPDWPAAIIPLGTANNIALSLGCEGTTGQLIQSWGRKSTRFNTATVRQGKKENLLMEAMGFGLFPQHILDMKTHPLKDLPLDAQKRTECEMLLQSLEHFKPRRYELEIDGYKQSGEFLMVQVMNISMFGPNLLFAPQADPGDGLLDVVAFTKDDRSKLQQYLQRRIRKNQASFPVETVRAKKVLIHSSDERYHIEDELLANDEKKPVEISVNENSVSIFTP
jgi:diacylglycerol kinase family enzyme